MRKETWNKRERWSSLQSRGKKGLEEAGAALWVSRLQPRKVIDMGLISSVYEYPVFPVLLIEDAVFSPVYLSSVNYQMVLVMSSRVCSILFHYVWFCAGAIVFLLLLLSIS